MATPAVGIRLCATHLCTRVCPRPTTPHPKSKSCHTGRAPHTHCQIPSFQGAAAAVLCRAATPLHACSWKKWPWDLRALALPPHTLPQRPQRPGIVAQRRPVVRSPGPTWNHPALSAVCSTYNRGSSPDNSTGLVIRYNTALLVTCPIHLDPPLNPQNPSISTDTFPPDTSPPDTITMMRVPRQPFSTAARIHPNIVPHLRPQRRMRSGW